MKTKKRTCALCKKKKPVNEGFLAGLKFFCSYKSLKAWNAKEEAKKKGKELSLNKKIDRESDRNKQLELTQNSFNKLRRFEELQWFKIRGKVPTCISCGKSLGGDTWACGHFISVGASEYLRFEPLNTYLQHNFRCNSVLSGDIDGYKKGLKARFGEKEGQAIIDYCESNKGKNYAYSCQELIEMRKVFNIEIRKLKKDLE